MRPRESWSSALRSPGPLPPPPQACGGVQFLLEEKIPPWQPTVQTLDCTRPDHVLQHMTKSQENVAVVLRKRKERKKKRKGNKTKTNENKTSQIKFSNTSVSRLHVSRLSIIYRWRPQRDGAELVRAGGSKLGAREEPGPRGVTVGMTGPPGALGGPPRGGGMGQGGRILGDWFFLPGDVWLLGPGTLAAISVTNSQAADPLGSIPSST